MLLGLMYVSVRYKRTTGESSAAIAQAATAAPATPAAPPINNLLRDMFLKKKS